MKLFDAETLGARIRRRRQELGMTQQQFAAEIGLSLSFYGNIERGMRVPSVPVLVLIANRLHVGADSLLRDSLDAPCLPKRTFTDRELGILRQFLDAQEQEEEWFPFTEIRKAAADDPAE